KNQPIACRRPRRHGIRAVAPDQAMRAGFVDGCGRRGPDSECQRGGHQAGPAHVRTLAGPVRFGNTSLAMARRKCAKSGGPMAPLLPGPGVRVRRGRRRDLAQLESLLGTSSGERLARLFRRILNDLGTDVYVAEDGAGEIVGLVSVVYARTLVRGGVSAMLDGARARREPVGPLPAELVAFAEERARKRGCRRLTAWVDPSDEALRATLLARGYQSGDLLVTELDGAA